MLCNLCTEKKIDNQKHMFECKALIREIKSTEVMKNRIEYSDIFEDDVMKQKVVTTIFTQLVNIKQMKTNPSTLHYDNYDVLKNVDNVHSFGK